jgi:hypothetical protein
MPCNSERTRQQDKYTAWQNAHADQLAAYLAATAAKGAVIAACPWFWTGLGTAACAAAIAAAATAEAAHIATIYKTRNAMQAYRQAYQEWQACLARCNRS